MPGECLSCGNIMGLYPSCGNIIGVYPSGAAEEFSSPRSTFCADLFRYPFHPCVTAVALKRSRSFCQTYRWQVTAKHAYTLRMWLCMKWHGAWLYGVHRTCTETAAVSCGTSHVVLFDCFARFRWAPFSPQTAKQMCSLELSDTEHGVKSYAPP